MKSDILSEEKGSGFFSCRQSEGLCSEMPARKQDAVDVTFFIWHNVREDIGEEDTHGKGSKPEEKIVLYFGTFGT